MVPAKAANKGPAGPAESLEGRAGPKGNTIGQGPCRAQKRGSGSQAADRMRQAAKRNPEERLVALLHHVTVEALHDAFHSSRKDAAAGVDGVTWEMHADGLADLCARVHKGAYRAPASRRVFMPREDGGQRPPGIAALEDKLLQRAVTDVIPVPVHETEFLGFSDGFRPGRGTHDALDAVTVGTDQRRVNRIVDADIRGFFDNPDRDHLVRMLGKRIGDKRVVRLIVKWLDAGVMEGTDGSDTGRGTPQGAMVSACLANVCLHHVLEDRFHDTWRKRTAEGDTIIVRHADDFVGGFQHQGDAKRFLRDLGERLAHHGPELHPDKTRLIEFGRFARENRRKRWHDNRHETARWMGRVINGWLNYHAVPGSSRDLQRFIHHCTRLFMRALRRRSQKDRTDWKDMDLLTAAHWPKAGIRHPWPGQRLVVTTRGRSRMRTAHVRICAGGSG